MPWDLPYRIPSARVKSALFWECCSVLVLCAVVEDHGGDAEDDQAHESSIPAPIGRLSIPTTGRRPDVFGVAADLYW